MRNKISYTPDLVILDSDYRYGGGMQKFTQEQVKAEPMFFSASCKHAYEHGGPITKNFMHALGTLSPYFQEGIFDSRTHMLMPSWYPCIPGWHVDDVPRTRSDGQPDHINPAYKAQHCMAWVGDEPNAPTEFLRGRFELFDVPIGSTKKSIYGIWNTEIDMMVERSMYFPHRTQGNTLIYFDWQSFHRGTPANGNGWRWFGRVSINTNRKVMNELRTQVQVYMPCHTAGW